MTRTQIFPVILIALDIGAAIMFAVDGDVRRALYWLFAAGLTVVITFSMSSARRPRPTTSTPITATE